MRQGKPPKTSKEVLMKKFIVEQHKEIARLKRKIKALQRAADARDGLGPQPPCSSDNIASG